MQQTTGCLPDAGLNLYIQFYFQRFLAIYENICLGFGFLIVETLQCSIKSVIEKKYCLLKFYFTQFSTCYYQTLEVPLRLHIFYYLRMHWQYFYRTKYPVIFLRQVFLTCCHLYSHPNIHQTSKGWIIKRRKKALPIVTRIVNPSL